MTHIGRKVAKQTLFKGVDNHIVCSKCLMTGTVASSRRLMDIMSDDREMEERPKSKARRILLCYFSWLVCWICLHITNQMSRTKCLYFVIILIGD
jgi:hypothetical protein